MTPKSDFPLSALAQSTTRQKTRESTFIRALRIARHEFDALISPSYIIDSLENGFVKSILIPYRGHYGIPNGSSKKETWNFLIFTKNFRDNYIIYR